MLEFLIGRAGAGKTGALIRRIKENMERGERGSILLVPEQYSHEAERELCRACGDRLSLYAEVLSFSGLARSLEARRGGAAEPWLDQGGRMLCMALALQGVGARLKVYGAAQRRAEMQAMLLKAVDELKTARLGSEELLEAAAACPDALGDKLRDLALVLEAYEGVVSNGRADPADRLTRLAEAIDGGGLDRNTKVYVDGFIDFTRQEQEVLCAMLRQGLRLTVCLTVDDLHGESEIFELSRRAARSLAAAAEELGQKPAVTRMEAPDAGDNALRFFAEHLFDYTDARRQGPSPVRLIRAQSMSAECEEAAALCLALVRDGGSRWRDIAIVARGFEDYRGTLESVFRHYGVPLFTASRSDLMAKPLPALISCAYEIIQGGWALDDVVSYLRTGLAGLDSAECDELESYLFKWQLHGSAWQRRRDWRQHPDGYGGEYTPAVEEKLARINALRRRAAGPLQAFEKAAKAAETATAQAQALAGLLGDLRLPETLSRRAEELQALGREKSAAEYRQLWELVIGALEQCDSILGESAMDYEHFGRLFTLMLSKYDIGTIPVSLDRVTAGDFDRNRRRNIKHLIVLGASENRLPMAEDGGGIFSQDERQRLLELDIELGPGGDSELWREFALIYYTLTLPSESLTLLCPAAGSDGTELRPAFVFRRAQSLFDLEAESADLTDARMSAPAPALGLAAEAIHGGGGREQAAAEYVARQDPVRAEALQAAAELTRGRLSPEGVARLYGKKLRLSASRVEKLASCRFAFFCQYGLKAKPHAPAGFEPPEVGTFLHYVLENVARDAGKRGGFQAVTDAELEALTDQYVEQYVHEKLNDFQEKSSRFVYLFRRLRENVRRVVKDMADELRLSDFTPLDFELNFAEARDIPPIELGEGSDTLTLSGIADRVDGWLHEGKLYLRVVDYKTGRKEFSLSEVLDGMNLQMLLYLFTLSDGGRAHYGHEIVPAGVMYIPARSPMLSSDGRMDEDAILTERGKELRRSGLLLDDEAVKEAWEHGNEKRYIPIKFRWNKPTADSLASLERLGLLNRHIRRQLRDMARQLRAGSIAADPYYRSQTDNACLHCDYFDACQFREGRGGERSRFMPKYSPEEVWALMEEGEEHGRI